ncbi:MAG: lytic murein transglycosylase B [Gammaproteobacteria bacterium]
MQYWWQKILVITAILVAQATYADPALLHKKDAQDFVRYMVKHDHFNRRQVQKILAEAKFQPQIIASMERPYEKKNWDVYQSLFLTQERLNSGLVFWRNNQQVLQQVARKYGVPPEMIVAILGVETLYGKRQGDYRVLDALTTLAFYYPARAPYFKKELREFLLLCREHKVSPTQYKGSYAGAMGKPQFMPSSYRTYAVDYRGRGRPDLMSKDQDVIISIANYFKQHGWKPQQMVVEKVRIPQRNLHNLVMNSKAPNYSLSQLLQAGIQPYAGKHAYPQKAGILEFITDKGSEHWMAYPNFYVITRYNTSPQYALVVYLLAKSLREHHAAMTG